MVCRAAIAVIVVAAMWPAGAWAGMFADADARLATVVPDGSVSALVTLSDGRVVYALDGVWRDDQWGAGQLMSLGAGGGLQRLRIGTVDALAPGGSGVVLVAGPPAAGSHVVTVVRVDAVTGRSTSVARIKGWQGLKIGALGALDDGTIIVSGGATWWQIGRDGRVDRLPLHGSADGGPIIGLSGGAFMYHGGAGLWVANRSGGERQLASRWSIGAFTPLTDGGVLAMASVLDGFPVVTLVRVGLDDTVTPVMALGGRAPDVLGNGDGLAVAQAGIRPREMTLGGDGSLIFAEGQRFSEPGRGLRAVVPSDSSRPRIALTQDAYGAFEDGRIRYEASAPGTITVTVRRGTRVIARAAGTSSLGGQGELMLPSVPSPGRYELRVRLTTASGDAEAPVHLDTRPVLPVREARHELGRRFLSSDGDEGGTLGTTLGGCRRDRPRMVRCPLLYYDLASEFEHPELGIWSDVSTPIGWTIATLRNDGIHGKQESFPVEPLPFSLPRALSVEAAPRQHARGPSHLRVSVRSSKTAIVGVTARLRWTTGRVLHRRSVRASRRLRTGGQAWRPTLRLPTSALAALRTQRAVRADITVRAVLHTRWGPRTERHGVLVTVLQ